MRAVRALAVLAAAGALAACGGPPHLPVTLDGCRAVATPGGFAVDARVKSDASKPISAIVARVDFYRDFRYTHFNAEAKVTRELDPGQTQNLRFTVAGGGDSHALGPAMRCIATRLEYLDGTSDTLRH